MYIWLAKEKLLQLKGSFSRDIEALFYVSIVKLLLTYPLLSERFLAFFGKKNFAYT
jgi:hypothetical protein